MLQKVAETRIYVVEPSRAMVHLQHSRLHPYSKWPSDTFHSCKKFGGSEVLKFPAEVSISEASEVCAPELCSYYAMKHELDLETLLSFSCQHNAGHESHPFMPMKA